MNLPTITTTVIYLAKALKRWWWWWWWWWWWFLCGEEVEITQEVIEGYAGGGKR